MKKKNVSLRDKYALSSRDDLIIVLLRFKCSFFLPLSMVLIYVLAEFSRRTEGRRKSIENWLKNVIRLDYDDLRCVGFSPRARV